MNCIKCKENINSRRLKALPQTKVCVNCSTTEAVGCVDITYHKTGNTIQIMDKASADKINKLAKRRGLEEWIDRGDRNLCLKYVQEQYESRKINSKHCFWLKTVIDKLLPEIEVKKHTEREEVINEEIQYAFRNWKNSKVYR